MGETPIIERGIRYSKRHRSDRRSSYEDFSEDEEAPEFIRGDRRQKECILTGQGFSIWRESRVALVTTINVRIFTIQVSKLPQ